MNNFAMYQGRPMPMELFPGCFFREYDLLAEHRQERSCFKRYILHFLAAIITIGICVYGLYYYEPLKYYVQQQLPINNPKNKYVVEDTSLIQSRPSIKIEELVKEKNTCIKTLKVVNKEVNILKEQMAVLNIWKATVEDQITKFDLEQDAKINSAIDEALDIFEGDGIGEMDYAATYAGGKILGMSEDTHPMSNFQTMSIFRLFQVQLYSNPEEIIRTTILPGYCFAFSGASGAIQIKLGKSIVIGAVTLSHGSNRLLNEEGMSTAPKDFEVYGFLTEEDNAGTFLGKFTYSIEGRQHQMFRIKSKYSKNQIFHAVELVILSNHGKPDLTCVYRFRVHQSEHTEHLHKSSRASQTVTKKKKCC